MITNCRNGARRAMAASRERFVDLLEQAGGAGRRTPTPSGGRRASIAALFYRPAADADEPEKLLFREPDADEPDADEKLLFIRRAVNKKDPWSGHVALPGGRQDKEDGEDGEATAVRETMEEVGVDLRDGSWAPLGRLVDDKVIHSSRGVLVISMFGFTSGAARPPPLLPQPSEVAEAWWVSSRALRSEGLGWRAVSLHEMVPKLRERPRAASMLRRLCGHLRVEFAAIDLPVPCDEQARRAAGPADHQLWGLTLSFISELVHDGGRFSPSGSARSSESLGEVLLGQRALFGQVRRTGIATPLVGEGAAPPFVEGFRPAGGGLVARSALRLWMRLRWGRPGGGDARRLRGFPLLAAGLALGAASLVAAALLVSRRHALHADAVAWLLRAARRLPV